jgi:hypothetical protein
VCPAPFASSVTDVASALAVERERSAFTWLLRSAMQHSGSVAGFERTLLLLVDAMEPAFARAHVARVMVREGRSAAADGPLFSAVLALAADFWSQPATLRALCQRQVRDAVGPRALLDRGWHSSVASALGVPAVVLDSICRRT